MNILIVTRFVHNNYGPWVDLLLSAGYTITFLSLGKNTLGHPRVKVISVPPRNLPWHLKKIRPFRVIFKKDVGILDLIGILDSERPDIIICRELSFVNFKISVLARVKNPRPKVIFYDQRDVNSTHKFRALAKIFISRKIFTPCCEDYEKEKSRVLPAKVIPFACMCKTSINDLALKYSNICDRRVRVISVGKLYFEKYNFSALFDSLTTELIQEVEIIIVGRSRSTACEVEAEIDRRANEINSAGGAVTIYKNLSHDKVEDLLNSADVMLLPGYDQVASYSQFEGLSFGLPVIICKENGTAYAIKERYNGLLVDRTAESIGNALSWMVKNRNEMKEMAIHSLCRAEDQFSYTAVRERFQDLFSSR